LLRIRKSGGRYGLECGGNEASMFARIGGMRALNRGHVREFNVSQKQASLGRRKPKRISNRVSESGATREEWNARWADFLAVLVLGLVFASELQAKCVCRCINGRMQPRCTNPGELLPPNCPMTACPMTGVTIVPIQPLRRRRPNLGMFATARAPCLPLSAADATRILARPFPRIFRATNDSFNLRRHQQAGWRPGPPQGVHKCGRRGDMARGNDPEGVAFKYEVLE
jgi:hypothetical protein